MYSKEVVNKARSLRSLGYTYSEIREILAVTRLPKSTLSNWCRGVLLSADSKKRIQHLNSLNLTKAQALAKIAKESVKQRNNEVLDKKYSGIKRKLKNKQVGSLILAVLYLAEGSKTNRSAIMFGNSDPGIIRLFLSLMRETFKIDESKFRCTVQCRADQDVSSLIRFWIGVTKIPKSLFYKPQIDMRSVGKATNRLNYKGVCRIDYFSASLDAELKRIIHRINQDYLGPMV